MRASTGRLLAAIPFFVTLSLLMPAQQATGTQPTSSLVAASSARASLPMGLAPAAKRKPTGVSGWPTRTVTAKKGKLGIPVRVSGSKRTVRLQQLTGKKWRTYKKYRTKKSGRVTVKVKVRTKSRPWRVKVSAKKGYKKKTSAVAAFVGAGVSAKAIATPSRPSAASTGVPAGTVLKRVNGDIVVTQPGTRLDALDVRGFVSVKAPNVVISRSIIRGRTGVSTSHGLVKVNHPNARNVLIEDSELRPSTKSPWIDGIHGNNFTARRVEITDTVDGVKVFGNNTKIQDSWIHDLARFSSDPQQGGDPSHNDGIQVQGGSNTLITGNYIQVSRADNAAIQVTQDWNVTSNLRLTENWVDGGACSINLANKDRPAMHGIAIERNRFGRATGIAGCPVVQTGVPRIFQGNVWQDGAKPHPIVRTHSQVR